MFRHRPREVIFGEALATLLFEIADASDVPIVLLASWASGTNESTAVVTVSSAELARLERRDTLDDFLARPDRLKTSLPTAYEHLANRPVLRHFRVNQRGRAS